ncbi:MAG: hypothetical protein NC132_06900 [Corallococcus sp.]|nr:hypothetical protein [Corallococcus sp.]
MIIFEFLTQYSLIVMSSAFAVLAALATVNWCANPYRSQNKKIDACRRKIAAYPDKTDKYSSMLPKEYQRQWRAYINTQADKPSLAFEFVPRKNGVYCLRLFIVAAVAMTAYIVTFFAYSARPDFIACQIAFYAAFILILVINKVIYVKRDRYARQVFARFVAELNRVSAQYEKRAEESLTETVKEINDLNKGDVTQNTLNRASELLRNKGLEGDRTVADQRKLNTALNGLLQAYSKNAKLNS